MVPRPPRPAVVEVSNAAAKPDQPAASKLSSKSAWKPQLWLVVSKSTLRSSAPTVGAGASERWIGTTVKVTSYATPTPPSPFRSAARIPATWVPCESPEPLRSMGVGA